MGFRRAAVVMAGGSGTRFWPVSTATRPKQFLPLASPDRSLLEQSLERIQPLVGDDLFVATSLDLVEPSHKLVGHLAPGRVFGEPHRRNTLGALIWAAARIGMSYPGEEVTLAVLTADHLIQPDGAFLETVETAMSLAESSPSLVTIGITPSRPATEFGYVELGENVLERAWRAKRFCEKPTSEVAEEFVSSGRHLWNSGMFFWTLSTFRRSLADANPDAAAVLSQVEDRLAHADEAGAASAFASLQNISIDYALMERADNVVVVESRFLWDDLGSWDALSRSLEKDQEGNVAVGPVRLVESRGSIVYNQGGKARINVLGMDDVVVVATETEILVCPKNKAQDVRKLAD